MECSKEFEKRKIVKLSNIAKSIIEGAPAPIEPKLPLPKQEEYRKAAIRMADALITKQGMSPEQAKNYMVRKIPNHPELTSLVSMAIDDYAKQHVSPPGWPTSDVPKPNTASQGGIARKSEPPNFSGMK